MNIIKYFFLTKQLKKTFSIKKEKSKNIVLFEYFNYYPSLIPFAYFAKALSLKFDAQFYSYNPRVLTFFKRITFFFNYKFSFFGRYFSALGIRDIIVINKINKKKTDLIYKKIVKKLKTKKDVLNIELFGVKIGSDLYDQYLRDNNKTEVDIYCEKFSKCIFEAIQIVLYWEDLFKKKNIKALIISHTSYFMALPSKIAIKYKIPVFCVAPQSFSTIKKNFLSKHSNCRIFSKSFRKLQVSKSKYLLQAKKKIYSRFKGKLDEKLLIDQKTETKLFSNKKTTAKIINNNKQKNILVVAHCFSDAVHVYGDFCYVDFHDWLIFIGSLTKYENCNFYIRIHPADYTRNYEHFLHFKKIFPKLIILSKDVTVNQLIEEKFDLVLTIYGSVGHEYPLFGTPVINASNNGPHCSYSFNVNPKNKSQYEKLLKKFCENKITNFKLKNVKKEIYEFYFMRYMSSYFLLDNWARAIEILGDKYNSPEIINYFLDNYNHKSHNQKIKDISYFVKKKPIGLIVDNNTGISNIIGKLQER